jgi:hypothetical protein
MEVKLEGSWFVLAARVFSRGRRVRQAKLRAKRRKMDDEDTRKT